MAFFEGIPSVQEWSRVRRAGVRRSIDLEVLMASPADGSVDTPPSPGHLLGFVLDSLFTDGLSIDLERMRQINAMLEVDRVGLPSGRRPIEALVIQPSDDLNDLARKHMRAMPRSLRTLLRVIGALEARGGRKSKST